MIQIKSLKHDQSIHRIWHENNILHMNDQELIGKNVNTFVTEASGKVWQTNGLSIFCFYPYQWFNIIIVFSNKDTYYYYVNIASPYEMTGNILTYIDYDIDFIVNKDYTYKTVDVDEYRAHSKRYDYNENVKEAVEGAVHTVKQMIRERQAPFNEQFINSWYDRVYRKA